MNKTIVLAVFLALLAFGLPAFAGPDDTPWIAVSADKRGFVLAGAKTPFTPWGFNYDHDERGRLLEDYWEEEWSLIEEHFVRMKMLGANVVRVQWLLHFQQRAKRLAE